MVIKATYKRDPLRTVANATVVTRTDVIGRFSLCRRDAAVMATRAVHCGTAKRAKNTGTVVNRGCMEIATRRGMTLATLSSG